MRFCDRPEVAGDVISDENVAKIRCYARINLWVCYLHLNGREYDQIKPRSGANDLVVEGAEKTRSDLTFSCFRESRHYVMR